MEDKDTRSGWQKALGRFVITSRFALLIMLPGIVAAFGGFAGMNKGQARTNLIYAAAISAILLAILNVIKEIQNRKASRSSVEVAKTTNESIQPLVTLLSRASEAQTDEKRRSEVNRLLSRTVAIAQTWCGKLVDKDAETRSTYYHFTAQDRLDRQWFEGRQNPKPRPDFVVGEHRTKSKADVNNRAVVEVAQGENSYLCRDVDKAPPSYFCDYDGRPYKSFLIVPVRAERHSFGVLTVDSTKANALTSIDVGFVIILAGLLASALSLLKGEYPELDDGGFIPGQRGLADSSADQRS